MKKIFICILFLGLLVIGNCNRLFAQNTNSNTFQVPPNQSISNININQKDLNQPKMSQQAVSNAPNIVNTALENQVLATKKKKTASDYFKGGFVSITTGLFFSDGGVGGTYDSSGSSGNTIEDVEDLNFSVDARFGYTFLFFNSFVLGLDLHYFYNLEELSYNTQLSATAAGTPVNFSSIANISNLGGGVFTGFAISRFEFYVRAGVGLGIYNAIYDDPNAFEESELMYNGYFSVGGGLKVAIQKQIRFMFDYQYVLSMNDLTIKNKPELKNLKFSPTRNSITLGFEFGY